jgi:hypothetical protein
MFASLFGIDEDVAVEASPCAAFPKAQDPPS